MPRLTFQRRVLLAFFLLATGILAGLGYSIGSSFSRDFNRYQGEREMGLVTVWLIARLQDQHDFYGSWDFLRNDPLAWNVLLRRDQGPELCAPPFTAQGGLSAAPPCPPPHLLPPGVRPRDPLHIHGRLGLKNLAGHCIAGDCRGPGPYVERPIQASEPDRSKPLGTLTLHIAELPDGEVEQAYLASQARHLALASLAALGISLLLAWAVARHLLHPLKQLAEASRRLAGGDLGHRVPTQRDDELGALAQDFNSMAERLADTETARRQWIADTSHELRTPIAVLQAEIEALQDGVHTPDPETLERLHHQTLRLGKLVDDLRQTLERDSDRVELAVERFNPLLTLQECIDSTQSRYVAAGLALEYPGLDACTCWLEGDQERLYQVYLNLLENTLRYTHAGGRLRITARHGDGLLWITFDDTAPAPPADALPRLFDRFYRVENSRSRAGGGSGLGLAICRILVEAHGGEIRASLSELGGLKITLRLPIEIHPA